MPVPNQAYYRVIPVEVVEKHEDLDLGSPDKPPLHPMYAQVDGLAAPRVEDLFSRNRKTSCPLLISGGYHRSRERTRQSAVQRLVERKLAQKEKEREKDRDRSLGGGSFAGGAPGGGGGRSSRLDTFFSKNSCSPTRLRETSGSRSENGFMLGGGRSSSPFKENIEPSDWARFRYTRSASGSRVRGHSEEPIAKTYISIGPGKPTRIREHSPAKSAKISRDENLSESRERIARSRNTSPFKSCDLNRQDTSSPHRKSSRTISPTRGKELLRTGSPLRSTDIFKTFRTSTTDFSDTNQDNQKTTPYFTEKVFKINQVNSNVSSSTNSVNSSTGSSRRPSVDILNNNLSQRLNKRASPDSDTTSSSLSSQASSLTSSAESVVSSASQRRISLEQRFQRRTSTAKFTSPNLSAVASVDQAETVTAANTVDEDGWTHIKIRRVSTTKTHCEFSSCTPSRNSATPPRLSSERPVPASRKISLPQGIAARRPEPAPRRRSLTNILAPERLADERKEEGNQLYKLKNYREALHKYSEAIDLCPQCASFYGNRSACYLMLGQPRQALEDSKTATSLDPLFVKGWSRLAKCSVMLGDTVTARQAMQRAGTEDQTDKRNLDILERFKEETTNSINSKDYRRALYCLDKCLEIATHSLPLKTLRAECLAFLGRYPEAQEAANGVLTLDNMNADAIYVRGLCLYYEDNVDRAFSHFQQVLRFAPDHSKAKEAYKKAKQLKLKKEEGNTAFKAGQLDNALSLYSEALEIDPFNRSTNSKLYFNRATVLAKLGKLEQSIQDCTKAIDLDANYIKAYLRRAKSYMDSEQYEEAVRDYEHVFKSDKSNREYRQLLQNAKLELRKSKRKDYYKILGIDKNANEEEIKKAYRKRAMVHHPDRHSGATEQEKKDHETKFKEVGEAYAILSDEKKRRAYDSGQDLDDMGGGHGFHDIDPNTIFQAFFGGGGGMGGMGGMGGGGGGAGGHQHFSFGPGGGQSFSFQFG